MDKIIVTRPFLMSTQTEYSQLDARSVIEAEADIYTIECPYVGLTVYCKSNKNTYVVTELDPVIKNDIFVGYRVKAYKSLNLDFNYRGVYTDGNTPDNPQDGDWYRNETYGISYVYQNNMWIVMSQDGVAGKNGAFVIYIFKNSKDNPGMPPAYSLGEDYVPQSPEAPDGWDLIVTTPQNDENTWMSQAQITAQTTSVLWSTPIRMTGTDGLAGVDGTNIEFVYIGTDGKYGDLNTKIPELITPSDWETNADYLKAGYVPTGWSPNALIVSSTTKTVWMSSRISKAERSEDGKSCMIKWQPFSSPAPWAVYGEKGVDGDGVSYIYCRSTMPLAEFIASEDWTDILKFTTTDVNNGEYDSYDGIPSKAKDGTTEGRSWTDEPQGVNATSKYEYVATRKKINGAWATSFTEPKLWASFGENSFRIELSESTRAILCDNTGFPFEGYDANDGMQIDEYVKVAFKTYIGNVDITQLCTYTVKSTGLDTENCVDKPADYFQGNLLEALYEISVYGFAEKTTNTGIVTITAKHPSHGEISAQFRMFKQFANFYRYLLQCDVAQVNYTTDEDKNVFRDITPATFTLKLIRHELGSTSEVSDLDGHTITVDNGQTTFAQQLELNTAYNFSDFVLTTMPVKFGIRLNGEGGFERSRITINCVPNTEQSAVNINTFEGDNGSIVTIDNSYEISDGTSQAAFRITDVSNSVDVVSSYYDSSDSELSGDSGVVNVASFNGEEGGILSAWGLYFGLLGGDTYTKFSRDGITFDLSMLPRSALSVEIGGVYADTDGTLKVRLT